MKERRQHLRLGRNRAHRVRKGRKHDRAGAEQPAVGERREARPSRPRRRPNASTSRASSAAASRTISVASGSPSVAARVTSGASAATSWRLMTGGPYTRWMKARKSGGAPSASKRRVVSAPGSRRPSNAWNVAARARCPSQ
ncbi:MAG: hypothetical protein M5R40_18870 [Anaerolineae bacterium]|nr:hypothetical protein [Anaerolineae bacterium]